MTPGEKQIRTIGGQVIELLCRKHHDYGGSAWERPVLAPDMQVGDAILCRMSDKIARLQRLRLHPAKVDESIEDTIYDLVGYGILYLARPQDDAHSASNGEPEAVDKLEAEGSA